jgi:hypothetical protein
MRAQLERAGTPGPKVIGIDDVSTRSGTPIVSWSVIWFGAGRSGSAVNGSFLALTARSSGHVVSVLFPDTCEAHANLPVLCNRRFVRSKFECGEIGRLFLRRPYTQLT